MRLLFSLLLLVSLPAFASRGGMVGNGGDAILQEFNLRGIQLAAYLRSEPAVAARFGIDEEKFLTTVKATALAGEDHLYLRGVEVDAINYPSEMAIEVSRTRWTASTSRMDAYLVQRRIALHEYLWIYGIDDTGYVVSNPIIAEIEKAVAPVMDPQVQQMMLMRLCEKVSDGDLDGAMSMLAWGLDLNQGCPQDRDRTPFQTINTTYWHTEWNTPAFKTQRIALVRKMLMLGANPNQADFPSNSLDSPTMLVSAMTEDLDLVLALLEFGADPNWTNRAGESAFFHMTFSNGVRKLDVPVFEAVMKAGGDVNFSLSDRYDRTPARGIVSKDDNADVVEALIKSGKTNWCAPATFGWITRPIDDVNVEYRPLLAKYNVTCGRFKSVYGRGMTCAEAQADALKQCASDGLKYSVQNSQDRGGENCGNVSTSAPDGTVLSKVMSSYSCLDYDPALAH